jgi:hypothetical protein
MTTQIEDFKSRLAAVLRDLEDEDRRDSEMLFRVGQMASHLITIAGVRSWRDLKNTLTPDKRAGLLNEFQSEGNRVMAAGHAAEAYAIQVLAISVIARTINDLQVTAGEDVLDPIIALATAAYRSAVARYDRAETDSPPGAVLD